MGWLQGWKQYLKLMIAPTCRIRSTNPYCKKLTRLKEVITKERPRHQELTCKMLRIRDNVRQCNLTRTSPSTPPSNQRRSDIFPVSYASIAMKLAITWDTAPKNPIWMHYCKLIWVPQGCPSLPKGSRFHEMLIQYVQFPMTTKEQKHFVTCASTSKKRKRCRITINAKYRP